MFKWKLNFPKIRKRWTFLSTLTPKVSSISNFTCSANFVIKTNTLYVCWILYALFTSCLFTTSHKLILIIMNILKSVVTLFPYPSRPSVLNLNQTWDFSLINANNLLYKMQWNWKLLKHILNKVAGTSVQRVKRVAHTEKVVIRQKISRRMLLKPSRHMFSLTRRGGNKNANLFKGRIFSLQLTSVDLFLTLIESLIVEGRRVWTNQVMKNPRKSLKRANVECLKSMMMNKLVKW